MDNHSELHDSTVIGKVKDLILAECGPASDQPFPYQLPTIFCGYLILREDVIVYSTSGHAVCMRDMYASALPPWSTVRIASTNKVIPVTDFDDNDELEEVVADDIITMDDESL